MVLCHSLQGMQTVIIPEQLPSPILGLLALQQVVSSENKEEDIPLSAQSTLEKKVPSHECKIPLHPKRHYCSWAQCSKTFSSTGHLRDHILMHTQEKPYPCPWVGCNKYFSKKSSVVVHLRIHTGEKPYTCSTCNKCFKNRREFNKHHCPNKKLLVTHSSHQSNSPLINRPAQQNPTALILEKPLTRETT